MDKESEQVSEREYISGLPDAPGGIFNAIYLVNSNLAIIFAGGN